MKNRNKQITGDRISELGTEQANPASADLDCKSSLEIARIINGQDATVASAVKKALPQIARAIDLAADSLQQGGRLIYVGTGTSGRIAALDAVECPPTFSIDPKQIQFIIAGGTKALAGAVESNEDSAALGELAMSRKKPGRKDIIVGIAASGRTPFTIAALQYARRRGAKTVAVVCNLQSRLEQVADVAIVVATGAEVISGSTRMKAGTAQKMVLNMISSGAMARLGHVYGNLMVNVRPNNLKLRQRAITILTRATGVSSNKAQQVLRLAGSVPTALVMIEGGVDRREAEAALQSEKGNARRAIASVKKQSVSIA